MDAKHEMISRLKKDLLVWEGFKSATSKVTDAMGLGPIEAAFPNGIFPTGALHEFVTDAGKTAASFGFISGLLSTMMLQGGVCLWISIGRKVSPWALAAFGIKPHHIIFIDLTTEKDVLWAMEEALKCSGLGAVIAEVSEISFMQSRRLQLAMEQSKVTGFLLRTGARKLTATTSVARWRVTSLPSDPGDMPGVGFPRWNVELLKVRNGEPGMWQVEWNADSFLIIEKETNITTMPERKLMVG